MKLLWILAASVVKSSSSCDLLSESHMLDSYQVRRPKVYKLACVELCSLRLGFILYLIVHYRLEEFVKGVRVKSQFEVLNFDIEDTSGTSEEDG